MLRLAVGVGASLLITEQNKLGLCVLIRSQTLRGHASN